MKLVVFVLAPMLLLAQSDKGPRCEAAPEVRAFLDRLDASRETMARSELEAWSRAEFHRLNREYPEEFALAQAEYFLPYQIGRSEEIPAARERAVARAKAQPESVPALLMAAVALEGTKTSEAIQLLERARALAPDNPWPDLKLAWIRMQGKFADTLELRKSLESYYRACPDSLEIRASLALLKGGSTGMWADRAKRTRARLERESDPLALRAFAQLWELEFSATPVAEHARVRARISGDLKRLETIPAPDAEWLQMLVEGRKQAGAAKAGVAAMEDRIPKEFPQSPWTGRLLRKRWSGVHPTPKADDSPETWDAWNRARLAVAEPGVKRFPLQARWHSMVFESVAALPDADVARVVRAGEAMLAAREESDGKDPYARRALAEFYLKRGIEPVRTVELLEPVRTLNAESRQRLNETDNHTDKDAAKRAEFQLNDEIELSPLLARAYWRAGLAEKARSYRNEVEALKPAGDASRSMRLYALGLLAAAENNTTDAMTYLQAALRGRPKAPDKDNGRLSDPLLDDARALFSRASGSEAAWVIWADVTKGKPQELTDGRWDKLNRPLPAFEFTDLSGKKWSLKALEGKTLFINLWATWCGPCREELPHFQKFYEQTKKRTDLAVFTLNIDDNLGIIEPFLKEYGYTFPVLPAKPYVEQTADMVAIPQNWVVDRQGVWRWQQFGFDERQAGWIAAALEKIKSVQ